MTLATRCPSCGTVFRVVQDQLRVSEGWVRCGRCNGVFNAAEVLFDIDSGASVQVDLGLPGEAPPAAPLAETLDTSAPGRAPAPDWTPKLADSPTGRLEPPFDVEPVADDLTLDGQPLLRAPSRDDDAPGPRPARAPERDEPAGDRLDDIVITDHVPTPLAEPAAADGGPAAADSEPGPAVAPGAPAFAGPTASPVQPVPSFLRTARRTALWQRPAMRAALVVGVAGLALALLAQLALLWRDTLAARWPATAPALTALCQVAGCSVQPLRHIEALSVHSSGLNRLEGSALYRLQVVLQNRADTAVMMPALELSLNDAQGRLVVRRVLQAAELGAPQPVLQAGEELPLKALMSTGERRVEGYTLELFYP